MAEEREDQEPDLDAPLEERREPLVDKGSASGSIGASGTRATDFRPWHGEQSRLEDDEAGDVGAGTGIAARDAGEEGTPSGEDLETMPGSGGDELAGDAAQWSAVGGEQMTEEGAAAGRLRDEPADEEEG